MGIARCASKLLLMEAQKQRFSGAVLQLGRQDIYFSHEDFKNQAHHLKVALDQDVEPTFRKN